jgi:hypothetical protein
MDGDDDEFDRLYEEEMQIMRELHGSPGEIDRHSSTSHAAKKALSFNGMSPELNVRSENANGTIVENESPLPAMEQSPAVLRSSAMESSNDEKRAGGGQRTRESHNERYGLLPPDSEDEEEEILVPSVEICPNAAKRPKIEVTPTGSSHHHVCRRIESEGSMLTDTNSYLDMPASANATFLSRHYLLRRPPAGPHITVTGNNGKRMYLRLKEEQHMAVTSFLSSGHLLHIPVSRLRQKLEDEV